jgi:hypothetical protein
MLALATAACSGATPPAAAPSAAPLPPPSLRILIGFVAATDGAACSTLDAIEHASGAQAEYLSAQSPATHAYRLRCPADDAQCVRSVARLRQAPAIRFVEPDHLKEIR